MGVFPFVLFFSRRIDIATTRTTITSYQTQHPQPFAAQDVERIPQLVERALSAPPRVFHRVEWTPTLENDVYAVRASHPNWTPTLQGRGRPHFSAVTEAARRAAPPPSRYAPRKRLRSV